MVSILQRPQGVTLGDCVSASIDEDYTGTATVNTYAPHNLEDESIVYVTSFIEDYNGFWPIHLVDGYHFFLVNTDGSYVAYVQDAAITYCPQASTVNWSAVELPIVYELSNDRWPTNSVDTARTISSIGNENGYARLALSGSLGTFEDLSFIEITGSSDESLNGVHQIVDKISTSNVIIDLAYAAYGFSGASVQLYYISYVVVVNVYSGLPTSHRWYSRKPIALKATLNLIPDENNKVRFSIADILKGSITIENNTLLGSLPNNLDAFTGFYIEYGESYDESNGYTITTHESSLTEDPFEGWAINADLEFKNQFSGFMSAYLNPAKFLTLFETPVAFVGKYFDLSFINEYRGFVASMEVIKKLSGATLSTETINLGTPDEGVIRVPITIESGYDQYCVQASLSGDTELSLADFVSLPSADVEWTTGAVPTVTVGINQNSEILYDNFVFSPGTTYTITASYTYSGPGGLTSFRLRVYDDSFNTLHTDSNFTVGAGSGSFNLSFTATTETKIGFTGTNGPVAGGNKTFSVQSIEVSADQIRTEQLCIDVNSECFENEIYLMWQNNLGGFDSWLFTGFKEHIVEIRETGETSKNIFPTWPKSYGSTADTSKRRQTFRDSNKQRLVRSQHVTSDQLQALQYIKSSILVQEVISRYDKRTVLVDVDSFTVYKEDDKLYDISFTITNTDDIPSQRV